MIDTIVTVAKFVGTCGTAIGVCAGGYLWLDGPLPVSNKHFNSEIADIRLAQSQTSVSTDRLLQSQLLSERAGYSRDAAALANPNVQVRILQIDQQLPILNRRIEDAERRGIR